MDVTISQNNLFISLNYRGNSIFLKIIFCFGYFSSKILIFWTFVLQIACVVHSNLVDGDSNTMIASDAGLLVSRDEMKAGFPLGEHFVDLLFNFCTRFNAFNLRDIETALFSSLVLISPGKRKIYLLLIWYNMRFFNKYIYFKERDQFRKKPKKTLN